MNEPRIEQLADLICSAHTTEAKKRELVQSVFELGVCHGRVMAAEEMHVMFKALHPVRA